MLDRGAALAFALEKWLNKGLWVLSRSDARYPAAIRKRLKQASPPILFGAGNMDLLSKGGLAIVGSRNLDDEAREFTARVSKACARESIHVVSGGARGVDEEAMLGALGAGGTVIGILADRLMRATLSGKYRQHLRERRLVLVSPYNPEAGFNVGNAMARNKFIYALADYGLVVSSSHYKGGTWAGAVEELKRESRIHIFVRSQGEVPSGNRELLKKGAMPFPDEPWTETLRSLMDDSRIRYPTRTMQLQLDDQEDSIKT